MTIYAIVESGSIRETFSSKKSFELNGLKYAKNVLKMFGLYGLNQI